MTTSKPSSSQPQPIKKSHEQSLADKFNEFLTTQAKAVGRKVTTHSLDGDDRDVGADYVLADENCFAIVEFKWLRAGVKAEAKKRRRLELCRELHARPDMTRLRDRCHYVTWSEPAAANKYSVHTNVYRREVCTCDVFGANCNWPEPSAGTPRNSREFAGRFISRLSDCTLSKKQFNDYLAWVKTQTSGSSETSVELIAASIESDELFLCAFTSIDEMNDWVQTHDPSPPQSPAPRQRGGHGGRAGR
jgi:hypothetical protein